ncbi:MAG: GNAT family N-acetyltransferase [Caulobacteraceae bacterium]
MTFVIEERPSGSGAVCQSILAELPEWFGIPASNADYARMADQGPAFVAEADGRTVGILVLKPHFEATVEVYLLAVRPQWHRSGVGGALIERARQFALSRGAAYLTVKTRGPSAPYEPYERTRAFYQAKGFVALEEFIEIWGPENPCLFMVKAVTA